MLVPLPEKWSHLKFRDDTEKHMEEKFYKFRENPFAHDCAIMPDLYIFSWLQRPPASDARIYCNPELFSPAGPVPY